MATASSSDGLTEKLVAGTRLSEHASHRAGSLHRHSSPRRSDVFRNRYGYNWDLCMVFPTEVPEGVPKAEEIVRRLNNAGLETYSFKSVQNDEIVVKIRAPLDRLARYAGDVEYTMLLNEAKVKRAVEGGSKEPPIGGRHITHDPTITKYRPHEYIYGKYSTAPRLARMYACPPYLEHPFTSVHRIKLIRRIVENTNANGCGMNLSVLTRNKALKAFFPYHDEDRRRDLFAMWVKPCASPNSQPLDEIKDYLGEKIAMYFALLGHYTVWLGPLAVVGVLTSIDQIVEWNLDATLAPYFGVFVSFWAVLMLEFWKRNEARLALHWGMSNFEQSEHDRAEFKGDTMTSFVDGSHMTYYPQEEYIQLMVLANLLVIGMLVMAVSLVAGIFLLEVEWDESSVWFFSNMGSYLGSFLLSLEIQIMNYFYKKVAIWTTSRENHRTDTVFEDVLIAKLAVFQFVNSYASLYYIAFVQPFVTECTYSSCLDSLCQSLAIIFCTRLIIANSFEVYLPRFQMRRKMRKERAGVPEDTPFSESEVQYVFSTYHEMMGPLGDMSEIAIQFGYVTLFVVSFPIAPLLAYISNYFEIRVDAVKILYEYRRPFPRGAQDIGTWQAVWTAVAAIAVATNAGLVSSSARALIFYFLFSLRRMSRSSGESQIFFTADELEWSGENLVWGFVIWQYGVFFVMSLFSVFVPDVPFDVSIQLDRQMFITSKIIDQIPDESQAPQIRAAGSGRLEVHEEDDQPPPGEVVLPGIPYY